MNTNHVCKRIRLVADRKVHLNKRFLLTLLWTVSSAFSSIAGIVEHVGTYNNWPAVWTPVPTLNDADDGADAELDFVGDTANPGVYVADDTHYLYFRFRLDVDSADTSTFRDSHFVFIDIVDYQYGVGFGSDLPNTPDLAFSWDSKSNDPTRHGLEMNNVSVVGATWSTTRMGDVDENAGDKLPTDINGDGRTTDGYVRTVDGQTTTAFGDTTFMDFAVSWSYLETYTDLERGQSWNIALGSLPNATDHNNITGDIAGNANPSSATTNGWSEMPASENRNNDFNRTYFVPLPEDDIYDVLKAINNSASPEITARTQIVPSLADTVVCYDHWEDGYEGSMLNVTQTSTRIWGDGILTNGVAPGTTNDIMRAGHILTLDNIVSTPRDPNIILYDARDRITATLPVNVVRTASAKEPGEALSDAVNVYPVEMYGFRFVAPVGTNVDTADKMFELCSLMVMAQADSTIIEVDADADGIAEVTEILNMGQTYLAEFVAAGGSIQSTKPMQGHLITAETSASDQMRWYEVLGRSLWGHEYFTPVGSSGGRDSRVYLFNPNASTITVSRATLIGSTTTNIGPGKAVGWNMPSDTGAVFTEVNSNDFYGIQVMDVGSSSYDWGNSLLPRKLMTELSLVGWGPGSGKPTRNSCPIWVAPSSNTTVYIDYDGDPSTGTLTDPAGNKYNASTNAVRCGMTRIYDNTDNDQTAMRLYTLDGTDLMAVWGEDPDMASVGTPHLDMGYTLLPLPLIVPAKNSALYDDSNEDGLINGGDALKYTIKLTRVGIISTNEVYVVDTPSTNTTYVAGSTYLNGINIDDDFVPPALTAFPLDEGGLNLGPMSPGQIHTLSYLATIDSVLPTNINGIINRVRSEGQEVTLFTPVQVGTLISGQVRDDLSGLGNLNDLHNPGLAGVTVTLYTDPNGDGDPSDGTPVRTNTTGQTGNFYFTRISPGYYVIVKTTPDDYLSTADSQGDNDNRIAVTHVAVADSTGHLFLNARSGLNIIKTAEPSGIWFPELEATYRILIVNTGAVTHQITSLYDPMLTGLVYVADSTRVLVDYFITNTVRDEYSAATYTNNDGSKNWAGGWVEQDAAGGGASGGQILITGGRLRINGSGGGTNSIMRGVDLYNNDRAWLSYSATNTGVELNDQMRVEVSDDGTYWYSVYVHTGTVSGAFSYDITSYIAETLYVRFSIVDQTYSDADDFFYFDNVEVSSYEVYSVAYDGGAPPDQLLTNTYSVFPGGTIDITFNAEVQRVPVVTNTAWVTSDLWTNPLYSTVTKLVDTNSVPDRIGVRVINDLNGSGTIDAGERGIRNVTVDLYSDPNADGDPEDGVLIYSYITDYEGNILFGSLTGGTYVIVQNDLSGFSSTADSSPPNDNWIPVILSGGEDSLNHNFLDWTISGLDINKTVDEPYDMIPGQVVTYSIMVSNTRVAAQGMVNVTDILPDNLTLVIGSGHLYATEPILTNTIIDAFPSLTYTNSNGSLSWASNWEEINDDGRVDLGNVTAIEDLGFNRIRVSSQDKGIQRQLSDVSEYHTGILHFDYRRYSLENDEYLAVLLSTNGTDGTWSEVGRVGYVGDGFITDLAYAQTNFDISDYLSTNTVVKFCTPAGGMASGDMIYFDNVRIDCVRGGVYDYASSDPPTLIEGYTIEPNQCVTFTYEAVVGFDDMVINDAHITSAGDPVGQYVRVSNNVASAIINRGWICSNGFANLDWVVSTNENGDVMKPYEVIVADSIDGFVPTLSNLWKSCTIVTNNTGADETVGSGLRFFRLSFPNRWTADKSVRYASREVYVGKKLLLKEGENFVSMFMNPDSNTLLSILGCNQLPAGSHIGNSTYIEWYGATTTGKSTNIVWLSDSGHWMFSEGGIADDMPLPLHEGFSLTIPPGMGDHYLPLIGRVPTNTSALHGDSIPIKADSNYNIISYNLPYRVSLINSGLKEAGFTGCPPGYPLNPRYSDELRIMQKGGGSMVTPKARILMNSSGQFIYWTGGAGVADHYKLEPDDALIIYSRAATSNYVWNLTLPYQTPESNMTP